MVGIIAGAFGAHALSTILTPESLASWQTASHYLLAMGCALLGASAQGQTLGLNWVALGTTLFSFSIYGLILAKVWGMPVSFLGPITPIGGALMIGGWVQWTWSILRSSDLIQ